jgi:hypothetical protein
MNGQTFSHLASAFRATPLLLGWGLMFAVLMGLVGAARQQVAVALREL